MENEGEMRLGGRDNSVVTISNIKLLVENPWDPFYTKQDGLARNKVRIC